MTVEYIPSSIFPVVVGVVTTQQSFNKEFNERFDLEPDYPFVAIGSNATCQIITHPRHSPHFLMCIDIEQSKEQSDIVIQGLIVHECVHIVEGTFRNIGEEEPGEETRAYYSQFLYQEIMEIINRELEGARK